MLKGVIPPRWHVPRKINPDKNTRRAPAQGGAKKVEMGKIGKKNGFPRKGVGPTKPRGWIGKAGHMMGIARAKEKEEDQKISRKSRWWRKDQQNGEWHSRGKKKLPRRGKKSSKKGDKRMKSKCKKEGQGGADLERGEGSSEEITHEHASMKEKRKKTAKRGFVERKPHELGKTRKTKSLGDLWTIKNRGAKGGDTRD